MIVTIVAVSTARLVPIQSTVLRPMHPMRYTADIANKNKKNVLLRMLAPKVSVSTSRLKTVTTPRIRKTNVRMVMLCLPQRNAFIQQRYKKKGSHSDCRGLTALLYCNDIMQLPYTVL